MKNIVLSISCFFLLLGCKDAAKKTQEQHISPAVAQNTEVSRKAKDSIPVMPVTHASFVMKLNGKTIYFDPVGGAALYKNLPHPDLIVITHSHSDHMDPETLRAVGNDSVPIIAPATVKNKLPKDLQPETEVMANGDQKSYFGIRFEAIPMYNLREEAKKYHPKGAGNGYVLSFGGKRIYVSGDTEGTPEMRHLKNIDLAFVCMNLPYTMPVKAAASAVLAFKPKKVYPYHYRGNDGYSDVKMFKNMVETNDPSIDVVLLNWYPHRK